ncbi:MAG TPA: NUDIX domain-containing protein [bacterium]|nr:NUDIX domain-containing protein [bacterium]
MKQKFTIGVFAIILNQEKEVLLVHRRDYDLWNLPGVGLESGESPWEGVVREVKEETGLDVEVIKMVGLYFKPTKDELVMQFECKVIDGQLTLNDEADKIEYFALRKLPKNTVPKQVGRIKDYFESKGFLVMKNQSGKSSIQLIKEGKLG